MAATAGNTLGNGALRRSAAAAAASSYTGGSSARSSLRGAPPSALLRPQRSAGRAEAAASRAPLQRTVYRSQAAAKDGHRPICHAILFSRTHTKLTLVLSWPARAGYSRNGPTVAFGGNCAASRPPRPVTHLKWRPDRCGGRRLRTRSPVHSPWSHCGRRR